MSLVTPLNILCLNSICEGTLGNVNRKYKVAMESFYTVSNNLRPVFQLKVCRISYLQFLFVMYRQISLHYFDTKVTEVLEFLCV